MKVSVCICTRNRVGLLVGTLERLRELDIPPGVEWELIVIDNGSTDGTAAALSAWSGSVPLRVGFEPVPGLARARNAAVQLASGDLLLWTDDDVLVDRAWVAGYAAAAMERPDEAFFGGEIRPVFLAGLPDWLSDALPMVGSAFAARLECSHGAPITREAIPYGANMATRAWLHRRLQFDERLGYGGRWSVSGEEVDFLHRAMDAGWRGSWVAGSAVDHLIPKDRTTIEYLKRHYELAGATYFVLTFRQRLPRFPRYLLREYLVSSGRYGWARVHGHPMSIQIRHLKHFWVARGGMRAWKQGLALHPDPGATSGIGP